MCGFLTIFSKQDSLTSGGMTEVLERGISQLKHRGPDSQKVWIGHKNRIGMAHARLSIIDLTTGDQPITSSDGKISAVVNGEFYGYEQIREDLVRKGYQFNTQSDSEILIHLYRELGSACLNSLRGEFAFNLWDQDNQLLFVARDRFGIKPLFYSTVGDRIYFASEVKALFAAGVPARWDDETVYQVHQGLLYGATRTLYQGVFQVPPGHFMIVSKSQQRVIQYWDFNYPEDGSEAAPKAQSKTEIEYTDELRELLFESIRLRLRADVPVACYLSGGLDSCAVLGIASQLAAKPIHAFTLEFEEPEYNEEKIAREMARKANATYSPIKVQSEDLATHFSEALWHAEQPFVNTHGVAKFLLSKAVSQQGYKVVLTGEGSDEIFAGYPHFRRDLLLNSSSSVSQSEIQVLLSELNHKNAVSQGLLLPQEKQRDIPTLRKTLGYVPSFLETYDQLGGVFKSLMNDDFLSDFKDRDPLRVYLNEIDINNQLNRRHPVHQSLYLWSKSILPNYILSVLGDRMEMGHSIEGRVPFLDHKLVESVVQMPVDLKIKNMTEKYLLREAVKPELTDTVYQRQKHPFLAPPVATLSKGPLFELVQDTLRSKTLEFAPFYDSKKICAFLDEVQDLDAGKKAAIDPLLMILMSCGLLGEKFGLA